MRTNKKYLSSEEENGFSPFELIKTLKAKLRRQSAKQLAFKGWNAQLLKSCYLELKRRGMKTCLTWVKDCQSTFCTLTNILGKFIDCHTSLFANWFAEKLSLIYQLFRISRFILENKVQKLFGWQISRTKIKIRRFWLKQRAVLATNLNFVYHKLRWHLIYIKIGTKSFILYIRRFSSSHFSSNICSWSCALKIESKRTLCCLI